MVASQAWQPSLERPLKLAHEDQLTVVWSLNVQYHGNIFLMAFREDAFTRVQGLLQVRLLNG